MTMIRPADKRDRQHWRVPSFIQGNQEWPICCGRSMVFVGQIDDDSLQIDPPPDAKLWWHDSSSFFVFTYPICLECKASGQQY